MINQLAYNLGIEPIYLTYLLLIIFVLLIALSLRQTNLEHAGNVTPSTTPATNTSPAANTSTGSNTGSVTDITDSEALRNIASLYRSGDNMIIKGMTSSGGDIIKQNNGTEVWRLTNEGIMKTPYNTLKSTSKTDTDNTVSNIYNIAGTGAFTSLGVKNKDSADADIKRALSHGPGDYLIINKASDYKGGTLIEGPVSYGVPPFYFGNITIGPQLNQGSTDFYHVWSANDNGKADINFTRTRADIDPAKYVLFGYTLRMREITGKIAIQMVSRSTPFNNKTTTDTLIEWIAVPWGKFKLTFTPSGNTYNINISTPAPYLVHGNHDAFTNSGREYMMSNGVTTKGNINDAKLWIDFDYIFINRNMVKL